MPSDASLPIDTDLTAFESVLRGLDPAPVRLDRDALMFRAGQSHAPARTRPALGWPLATAALALVAAGQAALLAIRPPTVLEGPIPAPGSAATAAPYSLPESSPPMIPALPVPRTESQRLALRLALHGLDALPPSPAAVATWSAPPSQLRSATDLLRAEIDQILNPGDPS